MSNRWSNFKTAGGRSGKKDVRWTLRGLKIGSPLGIVLIWVLLLTGILPHSEEFLPFLRSEFIGAFFAAVTVTGAIIGGGICGLSGAAMDWFIEKAGGGDS